jgi:hypothetical protein
MLRLMLVSRRRLLVVGLLPMLAACSAPTSIGSNEVRREPSGAVRATDGRGDPRVSATWVERDVIVVTTWGSGSCPKRPVEIERKGDHKVKVRVRRTERAEACTADLGPTSNSVRLPKGVSKDGPLEVIIDDNGGASAHLTLQPPH